VCAGFLVVRRLLRVGGASPVEMTPAWERDLVSVTPVDVNADSIDELLVGLTNITIELRSQDLTSFDQTFLQSQDSTFTAGAILGATDQRHVWATQKEHDSLFVYDLVGQRRMFVVRGNDARAPAGWDGGASRVVADRSRPDSVLQLLLQVGSAWDASPRGIWALDWNSGAVRWQYPTGPEVVDLQTVDVEDDGLNEVLAGSWAPGNGNSASGTDDAHTFVFMLDNDGKPRWIRPIGVYSSSVRVAMLERTKKYGKLVVACEVGNKAGERKYDSLFLLNAADSGRVVARTQRGTYNRAMVTLNDKQANRFIAVGGNDDTLRLFDDRLNLVRQISVPGFNGSPLLQAGRFTQDGSDALALPSSDGDIIVLDIEFRTLVRRHAGLVSRLLTPRQGSQDKLLVSLRPTGQTSSTTWRLYDFRPLGLPERNVTVGTAALLMAVAVFLTLALAGSVAALSSKWWRTSLAVKLVKDGAGRGGYVIVDRSGRLTESAGTVSDALGLGNTRRNVDLRSLPAVREKSPAFGKLLDDAVSGTEPRTTREVAIVDGDSLSTYLAQVLRLPDGKIATRFEDLSVVEHARRISMWATIAQRLAHSIKTPLATIRVSALQLAGSDNSDVGRKIRIEAERLGAMVDGIMRLTSFGQLTSAAHQVGPIVRMALDKQGVYAAGNLDVIADVGADLPDVLVDEEALIEALGSLIRNAVEAMPQGGRLSVSASKSERSGFVRIWVGDTGPGVSKEHRTRLFQPFFTRKVGGTGLGLALARKTLQDMGGELDVAPSSDSGAVFWVDVPVAGARTAYGGDCAT